MSPNGVTLKADFHESIPLSDYTVCWMLFKTISLPGRYFLNTSDLQIIVSMNVSPQ